MVAQGFDIRAARRSIGMTQGALASAIGLSQGYIGEMERGEKDVDLRTELAVRYIVDREQRTQGHVPDAAASIIGQGELATMSFEDVCSALERRYPVLRPS